MKPLVGLPTKGLTASSVFMLEILQYSVNPQRSNGVINMLIKYTEYSIWQSCCNLLGAINVIFHPSHRLHPATLTGHAHTSDLTAGQCVRRGTGTARGVGEACTKFIFIIIMIIYSILIFDKPGGQKQRGKKRPKNDAKAALIAGRPLYNSCATELDYIVVCPQCLELLSHLKKRTSIFGNRKLLASKSDLENRPENRQKNRNVKCPNEL